MAKVPEFYENKLLEILIKNNLDKNTINLMINSSRITIYEKGQNILNMGEKKDTVNLILFGIVRGYYLNENGDDITKCFSKEGDWCSVYNIITDKPSEYYIEALEKCVTAEFKIEIINKFIKDNESIKERYLSLYMNAFVNEQKRTADFLKMSAKERYLKFIEQNKEIANRIEQKYIASYLGITPSSLSRIKRNA